MRFFSSSFFDRTLQAGRAAVSIPTVPVRHSVSAPNAGPLPVGPLRVGHVELSAGRPAVPARSYANAPEPMPSALWLTDDAVLNPAHLWSQLADRFPATGLWPLVLGTLDTADRRPWDDGELGPVTESEVDALDPLGVLATGWADSLVPLGENPRIAHLAPFAAPFPGLADPLPRTGFPVAVPAEALNPSGRGRLGLVRCRRPADAVAVAGWQGAINVRGPAEVSAVLRSWEDRFGAVLVGLTFATVTLLVPEPPTTADEALRVAAEVAALCPDALWQPESGYDAEWRDATLEALSRTLVRRNVWNLWFD